jgi:hypothetical protein
VQPYIVDPNFAEGVRTVLVDRGSMPNWSHKSIAEVKNEDVNRYFNFPAKLRAAQYMILCSLPLIGR